MSSSTATATAPSAALSQLQALCLIIGNARSGSTLLGALLDRHPHVACANESVASSRFWAGYDRERLLQELLHNAARQRAEGRPSAGYRYAIDGADKPPHQVRLLADKCWNPALLLLHGKPGLVAHLEQLLGLPVILVHSIRSPYDSIATMHRRSGAPLLDRARWYFMHCDAAIALRARHPERWLDLHHETLLAAPEPTLSQLLGHCGLDASDAYLAACKRLLNPVPAARAAEVSWDAATLALIAERLATDPFLAPYRGVPAPLPQPPTKP
jgi:hypothetical protein